MKFLFTCGGTAGHIYPAVGVAGRLKERFPDAEFLFVGAEGMMETELVPREGYEIRTVTITNLQRSLSPKGVAHNLKTVKNVITAQQEAKAILRDFQPDAAIGTGGYVCYPVLRAAKSLGIPTFVHESNAVPGLTTKMLSGIVDYVMVGFEEAKANYKNSANVVFTGTPVRTAFGRMSREEAKAALGLPADRPLVLSVWGSLGSAYMNGVMADLIALSGGEAPFVLIHSAGQKRYEAMAALLREKRAEAFPGVDVRPYIYDMPLVMEAADLILCRSGASTLSELAALGKAAIFVPSPNVTNNHQEKNARLLERRGAAKVLLEGEFTAESLYDTIRTMLCDRAELVRMSEAMAGAGVPDATDRIVSLILDTIR